MPLPMDETQHRLLEAARHVFAAKGYQQATVREILAKAEVKNVAAINYYFGDKERLYIETVKYSHQSTCVHRDHFPAWPEGTPPAQKLRDFIHVFTKRMIESADPVATQLMMRELAQPTQACVELVRDYIRPVADILADILAELLPEREELQRRLIGNSIVSQILFYRQNEPIIQLLTPDRPEFQRFDAELLASHITAFSLAAIRHGLPLPTKEVHA